jgi:hypothetical protein
MATVVAGPSTPVKAALSLPGRRYDHFFFSGMSWLLFATAFVGFAPTYYLAGMVRAPLPSTIIHLHGIAFTLWMLLLVTQTSLVSAGRVDFHRRLGIGGTMLAGVMVVLGVLAATDSLAREAGPPGRDPKFFYIVPMTSMVAFGTIMIFAIRNRKNSPAHKRLVLIATTSLMVAAIGRFHIAAVYKNSFVATLLSFTFLLMLVAYDLWSTHKIHRATLWASLFMIVLYEIRFPIGKTETWHAFASWAQALAR